MRRPKLTPTDRYRRERPRLLRHVSISRMAECLNTFDSAIDRYRKLDAWGCDLSAMPITIRRRQSTLLTSGHYAVEEKSITLTIGSDPADAHAAVLHELAHAATAEDKAHGAEWRRVYAAAVREATGHEININVATTYDLDHEARMAVLAWLFPPEPQP